MLEVVVVLAPLLVIVAIVLVIGCARLLFAPIMGLTSTTICLRGLSGLELPSLSCLYFIRMILPPEYQPVWCHIIIGDHPQAIVHLFN